MQPHDPSCDVPKLWHDHKQSLRRFIRNRVRDDVAADDLLQDVLLKVYAFCQARSGVRNIRSWLFQIAQNAIIDYHRQQKRLSYDVPELPEIPENQAFKEASAYILPMIEFLPEQYATPLRLADIDGLKQDEVARRLGLSLSATKSRIQRARQLLKAEFITCCHVETDASGHIMAFQIKDSCAPLQPHRQLWRETGLATENS
jgi:RNA polymerase sigma-70 factor, ECF subfamily